jgi:hypothetical protein
METKTKAGLFEGAEVISIYTRAQAIEDGVLVDVSQTAAQCGIKWPVAVTQALWAEYITVPAGVRCQDEMGRLWDVVWMLRAAILREKIAADTIFFELYVRNSNREKLTRRDLVKLKAMVGPGDSGEPVITVMLPHED